jgi:hypothetical protein
MHEIEQSKGSNKNTYVFLTTGLAILMAVWFSLSESSKSDGLSQQLESLARLNHAHTSRIDKLTAELAEVQTQKAALETSLEQEKKDNRALTLEGQRKEEQQKSSDKKLSEIINRLTVDLQDANARADTYAQIADPEKLRIIKASTERKDEKTASAAGGKADENRREILKKFTRVSDDFTRPKVYRNDAFKRHNRECLRTDKDSCGLCALFRLTVDTDGRLGGLIFNRIQFLDGDDIVEYKDLENFKESFPARMSANIAIRCRLNWTHVKNLNSAIPGRSFDLEIGAQDDFTLSVDDVQAIRETLELATISLSAR